MSKRKLYGILTLSMIMLTVYGCGKPVTRDVTTTELQPFSEETSLQGQAGDEGYSEDNADGEGNREDGLAEAIGDNEEGKAEEKGNSDADKLDDYVLDITNSNDLMGLGKSNDSDQDDTDEDDKDETKIECELIKSSVNSFTYQMMEQLGEDNYFISPYSLCCAIGMVDNAAGGDTLKQINDVLKIENLDEWNKEIKDYNRKKRNEKIRFTSANGLWISNQAKINPSANSVYYPNLIDNYNAQVYMVDFRDKEKIARDINNYVSVNTDGMIKNFKSSDSIGDDTVADIINAVYFNGEWTKPFSAEDTHKGEFHGVKAEKNVDMMGMAGESFGYYEGNGLRTITLPYGDGSVIMNIILSIDSKKTAGEVFSKLSNEQKDSFLSNAISADKQNIAVIEMPKFKVEYRVDNLKEYLITLGMIDLFNKGEADLSILADNIYISNASHIAKLEVDELGSRASAATEIKADNALCALGQRSIEFHVDRPFLYVISDKDTGMILFIGQMQDL